MRLGPLQASAWLRPAMGFWIRVFGHGLYIGRLQPLFSERNGYARSVRVFGWTIKVLTP